MQNGVVGFVLAFACLYGFLVRGESMMSFWLGIGFGAFFAAALSALWHSRRQDKSRSDDALARIRRYEDQS